MNFEYYVITLALVWFVWYLFKQNEKVDASKDEERIGKERLDELVENHEERDDYGLFDEDTFWEIVKDSKSVAHNRYEYFLGAFKFRAQKQGINNLIPIDNLLHKLYKDAFTEVTVNASKVFFNNEKDNLYPIFVCLMIMEGRVFYANASIHPDLMANRTFEEVVAKDLLMIIEDLYLELKGELLPFYVDVDEEKTEND